MWLSVWLRTRMQIKINAACAVNRLDKKHIFVIKCIPYMTLAAEFCLQAAFAAKFYRYCKHFQSCACGFVGYTLAVSTRRVIKL